MFLIATGCLGKPEQPASSQQALAPIAEERPERLVDIDPSTLYTPEQLAPLLVLSAGPVPATIRPLRAEDLAPLLVDPAQIARIDLRLAHDPALWPADALPPGTAELIRIVEERDCGAGTPCSRLLHVAAGTALQSRDATDMSRRILPLLDWLRATPSPLAYTREASTSARAGAADNPWLDVRILVRGTPQRQLVPRQELDAPRDAVAANALLLPPGSAEPQPVDETTEPRWVEADPDGVPYQHVVDPGATLLTATWSVPANSAAAGALQPLAAWLIDAYQPPAD